MIYPLNLRVKTVYIYIYIYIQSKRKGVKTLKIIMLFMFWLPFLFVYICIYKYCHPQTECFVLSELSSVAGHEGRSKLGSKPVQLYARLHLRPLGPTSVPRWLREFFRYYVATAVAAASVCLHFYTHIGYQSAQFFRNALHYASGGRKFLHQSAQTDFTLKLSVNVVWREEDHIFHQNEFIMTI